MLDEENPKVFGLNTIDKNELVYITEGPFDSTFLSNAIAMCGADLLLGDWGISDCCYVYDNEPRNREICDRISKCIKKGHKVVIWPKDISQKDINDMILAGHNVQSIVDSNVYKGLEAELKFNTWKKNDLGQKTKRFGRRP